MQSYTLAMNPNLNLRRLRNDRYMTEQNQMPKGWKYRSRKLMANLTLTASGNTQIVNDYLRNTYQINPAGRSK